MCTELLPCPSPSFREVTSVISNDTAWGPLLPTPQKDKSQALKRKKGNFDASMSLSSHAKSELQWWIKNVVTTYNVINHPQPSHQITTDAPLHGLGAESTGMSTGGNWSHSKSRHHINYLEMLTIFLGLQTLLKEKAAHIVE